MAPSLDGAYPPLVALMGRHVQLRHSMPADHEFLYHIETNGQRTALYRLSGSAPGFDEYVRRLWHTVLALFIVERRVDQRPLGALIAYGADFVNGHVKIAAITAPEVPAGSFFHEATELFIDHLFASYPLRKLYGEVVGPNLAQFAAGDFVIEGRLKENTFVNGIYEDLYIVAVTRGDWPELKRRSRSGFRERIRQAEIERDS